MEDYPKGWKPSRCFGDYVIFTFAVPRYMNGANNVYNIVAFGGEGRDLESSPSWSHTVYR